MTETALIEGSPYSRWVDEQSLPVASGLCVDLRHIETAHWDRFGVDGSIVHVAGRGDFVDVWLLKIGSSGQTNPQRHLCEAIVYVISGSGTILIKDSNGEHLFEWAESSLFSLPMGAEYQVFNSSGTREARLALVTSFPLMMNLLRDPDYIFSVDYDFGRGSHVWSDDGEAVTGVAELQLRHFWRTNFVSDLASFGGLQDLEQRGTDSKSVQFLMADSGMHVHMSEIPFSRYKKAHRHRAGTHIFPVTGEGYSLFWYEGDEERQRVDWQHGFCYAPPAYMFHQHFNLAPFPSRYVAMNLGNWYYPIVSHDMEGVADPANQIEYDKEANDIRSLYESELKRG